MRIPPESRSLCEAVRQMLEAGLTQKEVAEVLARTGPGREDEYAVIKEVLDRRQRPFDANENDSHRLSGFRGYMS